jgi:glycosyltransferase involved in cell wall biosynthesis
MDNSLASRESKTISIVIRAYNEEEHIGRLLTGIMKQTVEDVEIILVDSGSTDATRAIASQFPVRIVEITPEEFTFGRSLNRGIEAATGDLMVIISAHCYPVYPDWLEQLTAPLQDEGKAAAYGKQRGGETNHFSEHQFFKTYFPEESDLDQAHPYLHNANSVIRKSLWEQHPFDEQLTGIEDIAWGSWAFSQGYSIAYVAEAETVHLHEETFRQVYNRYRREAIAMKQILPESTFGFKDFLSHWLRKTYSDLTAAAKEGGLARHLAGVISFRFCQYWGTFRGYRYSGRVDSHLHHQFYYPPSLLSERKRGSREIQPIAYDQKVEKGGGE